MSAAVYNIYIEQGATFLKECTYKDSEGTPIDLTGMEMSAQIRRSYSDEDATQVITVTILDQTIPANLGRFDLSISAEDTAAIPVSAAVDFETPTTPYAWDLVLNTGSSVIRLMQGTAYVSPEITR